MSITIETQYEETEDWDMSQASDYSKLKALVKGNHTFHAILAIIAERQKQKKNVNLIHLTRRLKDAGTDVPIEVVRATMRSMEAAGYGKLTKTSRGYYDIFVFKNSEAVIDITTLAGQAPPAPSQGHSNGHLPPNLALLANEILYNDSLSDSAKVSMLKQLYIKK